MNFDDGDKSWVDKASAQVVEKLPKPVKAPKRPKTVKAKPRPKVCACSYRCCLSGMALVTTNGVQLAVCGLAKRRLVCSLRPLRSPLRPTVERDVLGVACMFQHCTEHLRGVCSVVCALCSVLQHVRKLDYAPAVASHARTLQRA